MKKPSPFSLTVFLFLLCIALFSFDQTGLSPFTVFVNENDLEYTFESVPEEDWETQLEDEFPDEVPINPMNDPFFLVLLSTGDGNYFVDRMETLDNLEYFYKSPPPGNISAYMEVTPIYDKDKKKTRSGFSGDFSPNGSSFGASFPPPLGKGIEIIGFRSPRPGELMTYILAYENIDTVTLSGEITISTIGLIQIADPIARVFNQEQLQTDDDQFPAKFSFEDLAPGVRRNIFVHFIPKSTSIGDTVGISAIIEFSNEESASDEIAEPLVDSHDPNLKTGGPTLATQGEKAKFTITVENTGEGDALAVIIRDELDISLDPEGLEIVPDSRLGEPVIHLNPLRNGATELVLEFPSPLPVPIPGMANPEFGESFGLEDVRRTIIIEAPVKPGYFYRNNRVYNTASVVFDCHVPEQTRFGFVPILNKAGCDPSGLRFATSTLEVDPNVPPKLLTPEEEKKVLDAGFNRFKWYPASTLSDPHIINPVCTPGKSTAYVLIATDSLDDCLFSIFEIYAQVDCPLIIAGPDEVQADLCTGIAPPIQVSSSGGEGHELLWSNCLSGNQTEYTDRKTGTLIVGLTDLSTGCTAQKVIKILGPPGLHVEDNPNNCVVNLQVSGGTPPYTYQWAVNGVLLNRPPDDSKESFRPGLAVTVTDSNSCTVEFTPIDKKQILILCWFGHNWPFVLATTLVLALVTVGFSRLRKRS